MNRPARWLAGTALAMTSFAGLVLLLGPGLVERSRNLVLDHTPYPVSAAARTLHEQLVIGDWHADSLLWQRDLLHWGNRGHVDVPRLQAGNVAVQVFTAVTKSPAGQNYQRNAADAADNITLLVMAQLWPPRTWNSLLQRALFQAERLHGFAQREPAALQIIYDRQDLDEVLARRAAGAKLVGALLGIEGAHPLEGNLDNLDVLVEAGYRVIGLQHFFDNALGGSLHGEGDHGLTAFGREVVQAVAARPLVLDVAHSSAQVVRDVLALTRIPIVLSHTGIHSVCPVKRNLSDDLMRRIAASGGVIGIGYWADVTCDDTPAGIARTIRHAIETVGADHVSLGSDYDGSVATPFDTSELAVLTQALLDEGLTESQIRKVMGANLVRVLRMRLTGS